MNCGDERLKKRISQAFKMACIHYEPSAVLFRGQKYQRKQLIEATRTILDCEWEKVLMNPPFDRIYGQNDGSRNFYENFEKKLSYLTKGQSE